MRPIVRAFDTLAVAHRRCDPQAGQQGEGRREGRPGRSRLNIRIHGQIHEAPNIGPLIRNAIVPNFVAKAIEFRGGAAKLVGVARPYFAPDIRPIRVIAGVI